MKGTNKKACGHAVWHECDCEMVKTVNDPVRVLESMLARAKEDRQRMDAMRGTLPVTFASMHKIIMGRIGALEVALKTIKFGTPLREMGDGRDVKSLVQPTLGPGSFFALPTGGD